jgi:hypothetical protein
LLPICRAQRALRGWFLTWISYDQEIHMTREEFKARLIKLVLEALGSGLSRTELLDELEIHVEELEEPIEPSADRAASLEGR